MELHFPSVASGFSPKKCYRISSGYYPRFYQFLPHFCKNCTWITLARASLAASASAAIARCRKQVGRKMNNILVYFYLYLFTFICIPTDKYTNRGICRCCWSQEKEIRKWKIKNRSEISEFLVQVSLFTAHKPSFIAILTSIFSSSVGNWLFERISKMTKYIETSIELLMMFCFS